MKVILQNLIFNADMTVDKNLYYRMSGEVEEQENAIILHQNTTISTDTYMNVFDYIFWKEHTIVDNVSFFIKLKGKGCIQICSGLKKENILIEKHLEGKSFQNIELELPETGIGKEIYFRGISSGQMKIESAYFFTYINPAFLRKIHLSIVICTFHREKMLLHNLNKLKESSFFDPDSELYQKMSIRVVDNGSEILFDNTKLCKIFYNSNTGGSGGFTRGIEESLKEEKEFGISHIVLMDDDVEFINETFYRLYALLLLLQKKYEKRAIGGRMFRKDRSYIQYTALEIWNRGDIIHTQNNMDMRKRPNLYNINTVQGDYTGWWFGCFPLEFCKDNRPLPFFLHCDDVEYGLRQGVTPLILNGIQVWHETSDYRQKPVISYYDTRNSIIVNTIYGMFSDYRDVLPYWKQRIGFFYAEKKYLLEYAAIIALFDFMKGCDFFLTQQKKKEFSKKNRRTIRIQVIVLWRIAALIYRIKGKKAFISYNKLKEKRDETTEYYFSVT